MRNMSSETLYVYFPDRLRSRHDNVLPGKRHDSVRSLLAQRKLPPQPDCRQRHVLRRLRRLPAREGRLAPTVPYLTLPKSLIVL